MSIDIIEAELRKSLEELSKEVLSNLDDYMKMGITGLNEVTFKKPVFRFDDTFKKKLIGKYEDVNKTVKCVSDSSRLKSLLAGYPSYWKCQDLSMKLYLHKLGEHYFLDPYELLDSFCEQIIKDPEPLHVKKYIDVFINDLKKTVINYHVKLFIFGITPEEDFKLGDIAGFNDLTIRKWVDDDFVIGPEPYLFETQASIMNQDRNLLYNLTAVIEYDTGKEVYEYVGDIHWDIEVLLDALRLANLGRIIPLKTEIQEISINPSMGFLPDYLKYGYTCDIGYDLNKSNISHFKALISRLLPLIPLDLKYNASSDLSYIDVAFKWFKDALLYEYYQIIYENRIALAIASSYPSIEALYSSKFNDINELAAILLSLYGLQYEKIKEDLKYAYQVRSAVLHGSKVSINSDTLEYLKKIDSTPKEFYKIIIDYNRISLLIYILLTDKLRIDLGLSKESIPDIKDLIIHFITASQINMDVLIDLKCFLDDIERLD